MFEQQTYPRKERRKTKMVPLKFITCLLLPLLFTVFLSVAHPHQDENAATEHNAVLTRKETMKRILTATDARDKRLGGCRKMVVDESGGANGGTSKISSATHLIGECDIEGKGGSNGEVKQSVKSLLPEEHVDAAGFVAFTADYRSPRHHPPKNN